MGMYRQAGDTARPQTQAGGVWGWWLRLTAPPGATNYDAARTPEVRERLRRAGLNSAVAPGVALAPLLLAAQAKVDEITMVGIVALPIIAILALILNRSGLQTASAIVLILGMDAVVEGALVGAGLRGGGLGAGWLLTFDLFVVPLIAAGLLLPRRYLWLFAALHIAFILFDYYRLPHAPDLDALVVLWNGAAIAFARPILIQLLGAVLSFVEVRSTDQAIRRADRAEEIAAMEHTIVEQKRQLDYGIQLILDTHVRAANGDFNARAPLTQENVLWQIAASLNNLLSRLQRAGAAEHQLRRTDEEIRRLATAIRDAQQGRPPIWPAPAGTSADLLLELIGRGAQGGRGMRQAPPLQAPQASQQMPQSAPVQAPQSAPQTGGYSQAGGYSSVGGFVPAAQSATGPYPQPWPNNANNFAPGQAPRADAAPAAPQDNPWINPGDEDLR